MRSLWLLLVLFALLGCERAIAPPLIAADELAPREAEIGDRLEVRGSGFPKGRAAHVSFRGALHRPGEPPARADIDTEGSATSAQRIELTLSEALEAAFCGRGERAAHTTFRGVVEVAFPAIAPGAPPVAAEVRDVVLDLRPPSAARSTTLARRAEAERALGFVGLAVDEAPVPSGGLAVRAVAPGSRAEAARIAAGDVLVTFDGVRVGALEDLVPSGERARVAVGFRRGGVEEEIVREIALDGWHGFLPQELAGAAIVLLLAAALVLLFFAPGFGPLASVEEHATLLVAGRARRRSSSFGAIARALRRLPSARAGLASAVCASLFFAVMPFGRYVVVADLDIAILLAAAFAALATMGALTGGFRCALQVAGLVVPQALAIAAVVALAGSPRVDDIVRAQGAAPWEWFATRTPLTLLLFLLHLAAAAVGRTDLPGPRGAALRGARWACIVITCGTSAALFLGGWQLPLVSVAQQHGDVRVELLGSALFLAKAGVLVALTTLARAALPALHAGQVARVLWRWLVPLAALGAAAALAELVWPLGRMVERALAFGTFGLLCLLVLRLAYGLRFAARAPAELHVDPFV